MDFDQLITFLEVARQGSFSRAGEKVFRSQSAVSAQIRQLEQEYGDRLLDRSGARLSSIHAPAPRVQVNGRPNSSLNLASLDDEEYRLGIEHTKRSIDRCVEAGARLCVVHLGGAGNALGFILAEWRDGRARDSFRTCRYCAARPSIWCWRDHSAGKSARRATPIPCVSCPSMAAVTRSGARKASEIVIFTLRTLHLSR